MKTLFTIVLIAIAAQLSFAQSKTDSLSRKVKLSAYEHKKVVDHKAYEEKVSELAKEVQKESQTYMVFLGELFEANNIPTNRVSLHPDSLKKTPEGFELKLKPYKKK